MALVLILRPSGITGGREFARPLLAHPSDHSHPTQEESAS